MSKKPAQKQKPEAPKAPVQSFADLLASGEPGKALKSWNGMKVLVMDPKTSQILVSAGIDEKHDPASLTKLAFFDVMIEAIRTKKINPETVIEVPTYAKRIEASHVRVGDKMTISELISAMMLKSDNGAAHILYRHTKQALGADPVDLMNKNMTSYGLKKSHFINTSGLPADQDDGFSQAGEKTTTAREMAVLFQRVQQKFPEEVTRYMTPSSVTYGGHKQPLNHFLYREDLGLALPKGYTAAVKTGYTKAAGHNIDALITAPDGRQLIVVVLNGHRGNNEAAIEAGVPIQLRKGDYKGNHVRDALVGDLVQEFLVERTPAIAATKTTPATQPKEPPTQPSEPQAPPASTTVQATPTASPPNPLSTDPSLIERTAALHATQKLPPAALRAVQECRTSIKIYTRPGPESQAADVKVPPFPSDIPDKEKKLTGLEAQLKKATKKKAREALEREISGVKKSIAEERDFIKQLNATENMADPAIYTQTNYDKVVARTKQYLDAFVDDWKGPVPAKGGKEALRNMFHTIAEGAAGKETGWDPATIKGGANWRPHTGVYQTEWRYIADARRAIEAEPAMRTLLEKFPEDKKILELSQQLEVARGLPATSFAGQAPAFAGMLVASFKRHMNPERKPGEKKEIPKPEEFNGELYYRAHMMGVGGARNFTEQLEAAPRAKGFPGVSHGTYDDNYLIADKPYAGLNDLNPQRVVFAQATAEQVLGMMRDKSIHARNRLVKKGASPEHIAAFEMAFLPQWTNNPKQKAEDISRVVYQKDLGKALRDVAEETLKERTQEFKMKGKAVPESVKEEILCNILRPMPPMPSKAPPNR